MKMKATTLLMATASFLSISSAVDLDLDDKSSIYSALELIADGLMDYYDGYKYGGTIGMMTQPYYWWEAGAAWNGLLDWWKITGNDSLNTIIYDSLQYQVGSGKDFMPANQTTSEGNDDQGFWGITAMAAAEMNFTNPPDDKPQWLYLAQAVFNEMASRWDMQHCGGGLRWQIFTWNSGYDYKNSVSAGCMFNIGARLARYTKNSTYADWCEKIWDWMNDIGFMSSDYYISDGANIEGNCSTFARQRWSYNYGLFISGSAVMYDYSNNSKWKDRAEGIWKDSVGIFFQDDIMYESACQPKGTCNNDQRCFKAIFSRFLALTVQMIPEMESMIMPYINASAQAAAKSCSGGTDGHTCGLNWFTGNWDGKYGLGEQMCALEVIQNTLISQKALPLTADTGATSEGSSDAGSSSSGDIITNTLTITNKDRVGAIVTTVAIVVSVLFVGLWMIKEPGFAWMIPGRH